MNITHFAVYGLFGTHDVQIPFDDNQKILIGENGIGKTQVLNLLYHTLQKDFLRLCDYEFNYLQIVFSNENILKIEKKQLVESIQKIDSISITEFIDIYGLAEFIKMHLDFENKRKIDKRLILGKLEEKYKNKYLQLTFPVRFLLRDLSSFSFDESSLYKEVKKWTETIDIYLQETDLMYFPTYRRVEEDINKISESYDEYSELESNQLIQFGMADVQRSFTSIENTIDNLSKEGFAQFTKDILSMVVAEVEDNTGVLDKINEQNIDIILSRVSNLLGEQEKEVIKTAVLEKQFKNPLSGHLLQKLSDIYEKQQKWDLLIRDFASICNKYLINKKIFYDESDISIYIKSDITHKKIALEKLSSGEKQIISIFAKIYLANNNNNFIVLFDEPELSLSIRWQELLLPDIINSNKCKLLLAVTHSPFIFDNELEDKAVALSSYMHVIEE